MITLRKYITGTWLLFYCVSSAAGLSGNVTFTSNYMWRGLTQTDNGPALQGSINYAFDSGFYVGVWGSNVDFNNAGNGYLELDPSIGYAGKLTQDLSYDLSLVRYNYPAAEGLNYNEAQAILNYKIFNLNLAYTNNYGNTGGNGTYLSGGINYDLPQQYSFNLRDIAVNASLGHQQLAPIAGVNYFDYKLGISKKITKNFTAELAYTSLICEHDCEVAGGRNHLLGTLSLDIG